MLFLCSVFFSVTADASVSPTEEQDNKTRETKGTAVLNNNEDVRKKERIRLGRAKQWRREEWRDR